MNITYTLYRELGTTEPLHLIHILRFQACKDLFCRNQHDLNIAAGNCKFSSKTSSLFGIWIRFHFSSHVEDDTFILLE